MDYFTDVKEFTGENPDVKKFVFKNDSAAVEAVLYKYGTYKNGWQKGSHHDYNKQNICSR